MLPFVGCVHSRKTALTNEQRTAAAAVPPGGATNLYDKPTEKKKRLRSPGLSNTPPVALAI